MEESRSFVGDKRSLKRIFGDQAPGGQHTRTIRGTGAGGRYTNVQIQKCTNTRCIKVYKYTNPRYINRTPVFEHVHEHSCINTHGESNCNIEQ